MENYEDYSNIVRMKILILKYGVKFEPLNLFNIYNEIENFKIKQRVVKPTRKDFQVYDMSNDKTVIPSEIILDDGVKKSIVKLRYSEESPITLKVDSKNKLYLETNGKIEDKISISLVKNPKILFEKIPSNILDNNATIGDYIDIVGVDRVSILFFEGCYNWLSGKPCKFCDLHPKQEDSKYRPSLNKLKEFDFDVAKWWNYYKEDYLKGLEYSLKAIIQSNFLEHVHIFFMAGNMPTNTDVWDIAEETIEYLAKKIKLSNYDNYLNIAPHDNIDRLIKLKKLGIRQVQYNLEVVNEDNFTETCPGKMPYKMFVKKLEEAVQVMGKGNVRSNFVLGLDNMEETINFAEYLASKGIVFDYSIFQPKKCTPYVNKKPPNFDEVLKFSNKLSNIYKMNNLKPIFCSLSSRSSLINELYEERK